MTRLSIDGLTVTYAKRPVLNELSLTIPSGAFAAVLGPSGCGKTTLLRAIAGFISTFSGAIRFDDNLVSISSIVVPPERRKVGYVAQEGALFPHLSVYENIAFGLKTENKSETVSEMLELIGMQKFAKRMPAELSGGQQTRVALARSLATKPSVMLLDEPFSALDAALRDELRSEVVALLKAAKTTTLMVTHDREEALVSADLVALMRRGQIVQVGSPAEVYRNPISPEIAISTGDVLVLDAAQSSTGEFSFALNQKLRSANSVLGKVIIRPEEINISSNTTAGVLATIAKIDYYGHDAVIHLSVAGSSDQLIDARVPAPVDFEVGQAVGLEHVGPVRWFPNPT
jgi:iron(III) transport system ATP-binding protein